MERDVIEEATYSAVSHFNDGRQSVLKLFQKLKIEPGAFTRELCFQQDQRRIFGSLSKSTEHGKQNRKKLRARRKGFQDRLKKTEGNLYEAGGH